MKAFPIAVAFVVCATWACAHDLVPGWALGLMALVGIGLTIWADPIGGATDYDDEETA